MQAKCGACGSWSSTSNGVACIRTTRNGACDIYVVGRIIGKAINDPWKMKNIKVAQLWYCGGSNPIDNQLLTNKKTRKKFKENDTCMMIGIVVGEDRGIRSDRGYIELAIYNRTLGRDFILFFYFFGRIWWKILIINIQIREKT